MPRIERKKHNLDATGIALGRLAVQIALILRGKNKSNFVPYQDNGDFVIVSNIDKIRFSGNKMEQKKYYHHSGYLGGLREETLEMLYRKNPAKVLRLAVLGMLPKNKLRSRMIKRLRILK